MERTLNHNTFGTCSITNDNEILGSIISEYIKQKVKERTKIRGSDKIKKFFRFNFEDTMSQNEYSDFENLEYLTDLQFDKMLKKINGFSGLFGLTKQYFSIEVFNRLYQLYQTPYDPEEDEKPLSLDSAKHLLIYLITAKDAERPAITANSDGLLLAQWNYGTHTKAIRFFDDGMVFVLDDSNQDDPLTQTNIKKLLQNSF